MARFHDPLLGLALALPVLARLISHRFDASTSLTT